MPDPDFESGSWKQGRQILGGYGERPDGGGGPTNPPPPQPPGIPPGVVPDRPGGGSSAPGFLFRKRRLRDRAIAAGRGPAYFTAAQDEEGDQGGGDMPMSWLEDLADAMGAARYALGTMNSRGGPALVGEDGPELVSRGGRYGGPMAGPSFIGGGRRRIGGNVDPGMSALVGEDGPELVSRGGRYGGPMAGPSFLNGGGGGRRRIGGNVDPGMSTLDQRLAARRGGGAPSTAGGWMGPRGGPGGLPGRIAGGILGQPREQPRTPYAPGQETPLPPPPDFQTWMKQFPGIEELLNPQGSSTLFNELRSGIDNDAGNAVRRSQVLAQARGGGGIPWGILASNAEKDALSTGSRGLMDARADSIGRNQEFMGKMASSYGDYINQVRREREAGERDRQMAILQAILQGKQPRGGSVSFGPVGGSW